MTLNPAGYSMAWTLFDLLAGAFCAQQIAAHIGHIADVLADRRQHRQDAVQRHAANRRALLERAEYRQDARRAS